VWDFLQTILAFIITLGILITAHEWGHYWVAKRLDVKILKFSVGFGPALWQRRRGSDQTEFVVAAVPLGGYVRMLGEDDDEYDPAEAHRAFNRKPLKVRAAIVAAGPIANFIFAILAYMIMYMFGVSGVKPVVGEINPDSPAQRAGFVSGHIIESVNGTPVQRWESMIQATLQGLLENKHVDFLVRDDKQRRYTLALDLSSISLDDFGKSNLFEKIGFTPYRPIMRAEIHEVTPGGRAEQGGLRGGDIILECNGAPISTWQEWAEWIQNNPENDLHVRVQRGTEQLEFLVRPLAENGSGRLGVLAKSPSWPEEYLSLERYNPWQALLMGAQKTWDMSVLTLRMLGKMLMLEISTDNISGPISIAQYAGHSMDAGGVTFLSFLALISLSLGILNLLPIPMLDGGHLFLYLVEWAKGRPLSDAAQGFLQRIGLTLLLLLMGLAFFNDINRLLG
jgi:regulator of sigma E protease